MNAETLNRLEQLPEYVQDGSFSERTGDAILLVWKKYLGDDEEKLEKFKDIVGLVYLKDIKIEQLHLVLKEAFGFDEKVADEVALVVLCEMLYPVKNFYPGVEGEIIKLGGEIPKEAVEEKVVQQFANREEAIEDMLEREDAEEEAKKEDVIIYGNIENLISKYPELGDFVIGTQNSITLKDMPDMKPMIKYWIRDYKDKVGIYNHSNLDRVQYICHDKNTRSMNDEERRQLNLVVKSVDGEIELPYSTKMKRIDFSLITEE
ncbi:MAG: hypothetical protein WCQ96_00990 [Patescibacteria group bacterium]